VPSVESNWIRNTSEAERNTISLSIIAHIRSRILNLEAQTELKYIVSQIISFLTDWPCNKTHNQTRNHFIIPAVQSARYFPSQAPWLPLAVSSAVTFQLMSRTTRVSLLHLTGVVLWYCDSAENCWHAIAGQWPMGRAAQRSGLCQQCVNNAARQRNKSLALEGHAIIMNNISLRICISGTGLPLNKRMQILQYFVKCKRRGEEGRRWNAA
jgi:hypothetical protein